MGRLSRDLKRRKLENDLSRTADESLIRLIAAVSAVLNGNVGGLRGVPDLTEDAVGAEIGSKYYIAPWLLETLVNELLSTPKFKPPLDRPYWLLKPHLYATLRRLTNRIIALENAEDGIFLATHDVFTEMHRLGQRQFSWQRGAANAATLYRTAFLFGSGRAAAYFEREVGISVSNFVQIGIWLLATLGTSDGTQRDTDLSSLGITDEQRERALARFVMGNTVARAWARQLRYTRLHTAYRPSILRNYPVIAFGARGEQLRAPIAELIAYRFTTGLYLDVVGGGSEVWKEIGKRFELYCIDYLTAMLSPLKIYGEFHYGAKKARQLTPDIIVTKDDAVALTIECKAKRMTFEARFSEDPVADAKAGYAEIAKGIFQIWRFFAHARKGVVGIPAVHPDCVGMVLTNDPWLTMARNQEKEVYNLAHALADEEGGIEVENRCHVPVCFIDDVEYAVQHGTAETFLAACRALTTRENKGWIFSVAHVSESSGIRPYPFVDRIPDLLPWWSPRS